MRYGERQGGAGRCGADMLGGMSERPLHVLHLTAWAGPGGVSRYLSDLSAGLTARGHRVTIAGAAEGPELERLRDEGGRWRWVDAPLNGGARDLWRSWHLLRRLVRDERVDVVHSHYRKCLAVGRVLGRTTRAASLFTLHLAEIPGAWVHRLGRGVGLGLGQHVHAPSASAARWLVERAGVPRDAVTTIPHGVDPQRWSDDTAARGAAKREERGAARAAARGAARRSLGIADDEVVAGFVGRLEPQKQPMWLIDVASATADLPRPPRVLVMGGGPLEGEMRAAARELEGKGAEAERVVFLPYGDPLAVYRAMDLLLLPSRHEGFALVGAEAMMAGRPVLRTATAGAAEQVVGDAVGRVVPVDREAFVAAAVELLRDPERLVAMGRAAGEHARTHLTLDRQVDQTVELYRRLIAGGRKTAT